ncbi:hypothetical protein Ae201684P_020021 [Aphanomyces euteiches]|nr:hypothetical protein Ae201684P_020021 [Aphanomyces euteiches]
MAAEIEKSRREQEESRAILLQQQQQLQRQQEELKLAMAQQAKVTEDHQSLLQQASEAMRQQHSKVEELDKKVRRDIERWGLYAAAANQRPPVQAAPTAIGRPETLTGVQQVPLAPMYKVSTKRERREFMDEYLAYSRRVEALIRGVGGILFLMPLAASIDQKIVPRVCEHDFGKPARTRPRVGTKAMASLKMDTRIRDAESRVGRLLADFYEKLEQLDVAHLPSQEPKQSVKILTAAIRPAALKATVERQLAREANKVYKSSVPAFGRWLTQLLDNFMLFESQMATAEKKPEEKPARRQYGEKFRHQQQPQQRKPEGQAKGHGPAAKQGHFARGCLKCGSDDHKVAQCPKCAPGEAQRLLEQRAKRPPVAANTPAAAPSGKPKGKKNVVGATIDVSESKLEVLQEPRTVPCTVNGVDALALLDSGADQSVVSPALIARLSDAGALLAPVCKLESALELGGFMEDMKLLVDREVKLKLTFDTAEGRLVLTNLKCWVAAAPLHNGLGDVIVSRAVIARQGYSPRSLLETARRAQKVYDLDHLGGQDTCLMATIKILEDKKKPPVAPEEVALNVDEELSCFPQLKEKVGECRVAGCDDSYAVELGKLLVKYEDVFRLKLGRDPPVKVEPLRVTLKADAKPVRCKARRYSKEQREFMAKHVDELQAAGLCYRNPRSKWCSAPLIVKKPEANEFRMTVDVRPVNAQTERILWPMLMLEVILDHLCGAQVFFTLDFFKLLAVCTAS